MQIKLIEKGEHKEIHVQDMPKRQEAQIFLEMLNHLDPFIHTLPFWHNRIAWDAYFEGCCVQLMMNTVAEDVGWYDSTNASSTSAGGYSSR